MPRIETPWGPWDALPLPEAVALLQGLETPWWVSGGYAIELAVGRAYRDHGDVDLSVLRPWPLDEVLPEHAHDIWVREDAAGPWRFQLMLDEAEDQDWLYRRNPAIRRPLRTLTVAEDGFQRLAPEVQLLYKSNGLRPKDELDFTETLPVLTGSQKQWLDEALAVEHGTHPWCDRLRA
jgi:hypothetical protein